VPESAPSFPSLLESSGEGESDALPLSSVEEDVVDAAETPLWMRCRFGDILSRASRPAKIRASLVVSGVVGVIAVAEEGDKMPVAGTICSAWDKSCALWPSDPRRGRTEAGGLCMEAANAFPVSLTCTGGESGAKSQLGRSRTLLVAVWCSPWVLSIWAREAAAARPSPEVTRLRRFLLSELTCSRNCAEWAGSLSGPSGSSPRVGLGWPGYSYLM